MAQFNSPQGHVASVFPSADYRVGPMVSGQPAPYVRGKLAKGKTMRVFSQRVWVLLILAAVFGACGAGAEEVDKAGGVTVVLELASIDPVNNNGQSYGVQTCVESLAEVSGGRLQVEVTTAYGDGAHDAESDLVAAIAAGEVDGGWPSTRAFAGGGIDGLEAVEAPMVITNYQAQKELVSGPVAEQILAKLEGSGMVGLGLVVGPLRRPFTTVPILDPEDWAGARIRVFNSPTQFDAMRALGAEPVNLSFEWVQKVRDGELEGAEFDIAQYRTNDLRQEVGHVTSNVVLWPKVFVLALSQEKFDSLSEEQQGWVREAAERAITASVEAEYDETTPARELCDVGLRFVEATPDQLAGLREAFVPVIESLAANPESGALLSAIQGIAAEHPDTDVPDVPAGCTQVASDAAAGDSGIPVEVAGIPDGVYRVEISEDEVEAYGSSNANGWSGIWTMTIQDGTYALTCRPLNLPGKDCGSITFDDFITFDTVLDAGFLRGTGDTVFFVYDSETHSSLTGCELPCFPVPTYSMTWEMEGDQLTFTYLDGAEEVAKLVEPWRQIVSEGSSP